MNVSSHTLLKPGAGDPIVFLHGFLGSPFDWLPVTSLLSNPCLGLYLPGHGADTLHIDLPRFHLVGYSLGARLALTIPNALSYTLLSVHPGLKTQEEKDLRLQSDLAWAKVLRTMPIDAFLQRWYNQPIFCNFVPDLSMRRQHDPHALADTLIRYSLAHQEYRPLHDVLVGEHDKKFRALHDNPIVIPNAGHMVHLQNPEAVAREIQRNL
jgi:2-succinyl-6-hydroxy-2,4-cyclohexadiene-1-carboxylate synthase